GGTAAAKPAAATRKLSYKEQRELDALPAKIEALETEQKKHGEHLADPDNYTRETHQKVAELQARYAAIDDELLSALERWEQLGAR
ncbi:MAG: ABC transporter C-terminal domain-containing protein, partial [Aquincola tertiaricarbonis]